MVSKEQRRNELARAKLARQAARREQDEARRRLLSIIAAVVGVLVVVGGVTFLSLRNNDEIVPAASPTASADPNATTSSEPTRTRTRGGNASETPVASGCTYVPDGEETTVTPPPEGDAAPLAAADVTMVTTQGDVTLALDPATAPCTVQSFVSLAGQGYFDGTTCHRLTTGGSLSVLQCGDPLGTGSGGPGYSFADETNDTMTYPRGTVAMANAGPDTNGSQFFLVYADSELPPDYTVFGEITGGLDVLDAIGAAGTDNGTGDGAPVEPVDITSVTVSTGA